MKYPIAGMAAALLLALTALDARAGVDVEVDLNARVRVTHDPEFETQRFRFTATKGTRLNIILVAGRRSKLDLAPVLTGPGGAIDLGSARRFNDRGNRVIVRALEVTDTGEHILDVTATGTGPFSLRLKGTPQRAWVTTVSDLGAAAETNVPFSAGDGARVFFRAIAPRGSAATPRLTDFLGSDLSETGRRTGRAHTLRLPGLGAGDGGDLTVGLRNDGTDAGAIKVIVTTPPRRVRLSKLDFRSNRLGAQSGDEAARSATVGNGGGIVEVEDPSSGLDGAGVDVPAGALMIPTRIVVTSAADLPPESEEQPGGPAVEFGPEGLEFVTEATVTLPLDVTMLPVGTQPSDIRVIKVSANGTRVLIDPADEDVDLIAGTVSVPTTSFSTFQANVPIGLPTLNGRQYWLASIGAAIIRTDLGNDSRDRLFTSAAGSVSVSGGEYQSSAVNVQADAREVFFSHDVNGNSSVSSSTFADTPTEDSWHYGGSDGQKIIIESGLEEPSTEFAIADDGSILFHAPDDAFSAQNEPELAILVERSRNPPTQASVAGSYWLSSLIFEAFGAGEGPVVLFGARRFGTLGLSARGTWSASVTDRFKGFDPDNGDYFFARAAGSDRGTYSVQNGDSSFVGSLELVSNRPGEPGQFIRLFPAKDRSMMVGVAQGPGSSVELYVLVRKSTNLRAADVAGTYCGAAIGIEELTTYTPSQGTFGVPDFLAFSGAGEIVVANNDVALTNYREVCIVRDPNVTGGVRTDEFGPFSDVPSRLGVARTGRLVFVEQDEEDPVRILGAITRSARFGFFTDDPAAPSDAFAIDVFVRPPPPGLRDDL